MEHLFYIGRGTLKKMQQQDHTLVPGEYDSASLSREIVDVAVDKKASDVTLMDIRQETTLADFFVIATGSSDRQINAVARAVEERTDELGLPMLRKEGLPADGWVLLDYGQIIVHLFGPEERAYYDLERRWKDASTLLRIQ